MTKDKIIVSNYTSFIPMDNDKKVYKVILNDNGDELGFEVKGLLTTFNMLNENGMTFEKTSYDRAITDYFEANELNIPIDLMHNRNDVRHLAGVASKFVKKSNGIELTAFIPKGVYYYNLIKVLLDNGVLQGFSNLGALRDYEYNPDTEEVTVKDFFLISASLVDVPADVGGKFIENATQFDGFRKKEIEESDKKGITNQLDIFGL